MGQAWLICGGNSHQRQKKVREFYIQIKPEGKFENDPDIYILTGETSMTIEQVRELKHFLSLKPFAAPPKVAIILAAEKLTFEAQGALLKLLEEPPGETVVFLTMPNSALVLPTIVSRCQTVNLPPQIEISLAEEERKNYQAELQKIFVSSPGGRIKFLEKIKNKEEAEKFCQIQLVFWREILLKKPTSENAQVVREIQKTLKYLSANVHPRLALENLLLSYPTLK